MTLRCAFGQKETLEPQIEGVLHHVQADTRTLDFGVAHRRSQLGDQESTPYVIETPPKRRSTRHGVDARGIYDGLHIGAARAHECLNTGFNRR